MEHQQTSGEDQENVQDEFYISRRTSSENYFKLPKTLCKCCVGATTVIFIAGEELAFKFRATAYENKCMLYQGWNDFSKHFNTTSYDYFVKAEHVKDSIFEVKMTNMNNDQVDNYREYVLIQLQHDQTGSQLSGNLKEGQENSFHDRIKQYPCFGQVLSIYRATTAKLVLPLKFMLAFHHYRIIQVEDAHTGAEYDCKLKWKKSKSGEMVIESGWESYCKEHVNNTTKFIKLEVDAPKLVA